MIKLANMQSRKSPKQKIKIGYIITKGVWGGAGKYVYSLATSLPKDKYDVFVITGEGEILKRRLTEAGIRTYEIKNLKRDVSFLSEIASFAEIFQIIFKENPKILHLNSPKASGLGAVIGRMLLTPKIIQTIHGWSFNEERNFFSKILIYLFSWITTLLCDKTIVIAKAEKTQAEKMPFINKKKITLVRNGIEKIEYINRDIVRRALIDRITGNISGVEISINTVWIGTICELHKNKGLDFAIEALSEIKSDFVFFIIGEGEEREKLEKLVYEREMGNKIFLVGFIDIAKYYLKAFDIFTLTSRKEGLPYTLLEAGRAGTTILANSVGGIPDIINNEENGILINKMDKKEFKTKMEYLLSNPKIRKEFGKKIKEKIDKEFSIDEMLKKTFTLYK